VQILTCDIRHSLQARSTPMDVDSPAASDFAGAEGLLQRTRSSGVPIDDARCSVCHGHTSTCRIESAEEDQRRRPAAAVGDHLSHVFFEGPVCSISRWKCRTDREKR
jgi:hypothetical protein